MERAELASDENTQKVQGDRGQSQGLHLQRNGSASESYSKFMLSYLIDGSKHDDASDTT